MAKPARTQRRKKPEIDPRLIVLGAIGMIVVIIAVMMATRDTSREDQVHGATQTAQRAPAAADFTLDGVNGSVTLADYRGSYVLVNFWATWCPPCMREMPDLYAYYQAHQSDNFTLLGVNVGEDATTVQSFLQANHFDFPVGLDASGAVMARYGTDSLPSSFLIGPDGSLVKIWEPGALSRAQLESDVTPLLRG